MKIIYTATTTSLHNEKIRCMRRRQSHPGLHPHPLVSLGQKYSGYIKDVVLNMIVCTKEGFQWLSEEAVSEEDVSRTIVSKQSDSGTMHRD